MKRYFIQRVDLAKNLLLAHGANLLLSQPLFDALCVKRVAAGKHCHFLVLFGVVVTDRAQLFGLVKLVHLSGQFLYLLLSQTLAHRTHFLLQLKQLLITHAINVHLNPVLVLHAHNHVPQVLHVHHSVLLAFILTYKYVSATAPAAASSSSP